MDTTSLIIKMATLAYREVQIDNLTDNSLELIEEISKTLTDGKNKSNFSIMMNDFKDAIITMYNSPQDYKSYYHPYLEDIKIAFKGNSEIIDPIEDNLSTKLNSNQLKKSIIKIRNTLNNYIREYKIKAILYKASNTFKLSGSINDTNKFLENLITELEPLQTVSSLKDPAIISDIDIGDETAVGLMFEEVKAGDDTTSIMKTGWQGLNDMMQGGFRRGETVLIGALPHRYKTGFTLSSFAHVAQFNKPFMLDAGKKPLLVRMSFEDTNVDNLKFLYQLLKHQETGKNINCTNTSSKEMTSYVKGTLQENGYHVKLMHVDPTLWSYKNIIGKILEYEAEGYEIHMLMLDYLFKLPTTGCTQGLPMGLDLRDMLRRMRNFCLPRKIALVTPQQLSPEAKMLLRNLVSEDRFVKEIAEKGYWDRCKSLDVDADLELQIHVFKYNREGFFAVQRGKHRVPTIIDEEKKYMLMKFPKTMPIPADIHGERISMKKLSEFTRNKDDSMFEF